MSLSISSYFRSMMQSTSVNSIQHDFTFNGSDVSGRVVRYGTISHDITDIVGGTFVVELENASQTFNSVLTTKTQFLKTGTYRFGFADGQGSHDTVQLFGGALIEASLPPGRAVLRFKDKLATLSTRRVGTKDTPVSFTSSNYNPADLAWYIQSSYGGLSAVKSSSNPDVDYATWLSWWTQFDDDSVVVQAEFTGESVTEALEAIAKLTDSVIYDEGDNALDYARWAGVTSYTHTITNSHVIGDPELSITADEMINRARVGFGYNPSSDTWTGAVVAQNSSSVNSYGLYEEIYEDTRVWYVNSVAALNQAERIVFRRKEPNTKVRVTTPIRYLDAVVGDMVEFTSAVYSFDQKIMTLTGYTIDVEDKTMVLDIDEGFGRASGKIQGFILDDAYWGLLDAAYNPLYALPLFFIAKYAAILYYEITQGLQIPI